MQKVTPSVLRALLPALIRAREPVMIYGAPGCLDGETLITYLRGKRNCGRPIRLRDLHAKWHGKWTTWGRWQKHGLECFVQSYSHSTGEVSYQPIADIVYSGVKPCIVLTLSNDASLTLTRDHPVLTPNGYVLAGVLSPGDVVLCRGSMKANPSGREKKVVRERVTVYGLKFYSGGMQQNVTDPTTGVTYVYRRQHRSRLVVEAAMNGLSYGEYIRRLKSDPKAVDLHFLQTEQEVHHINGDTMDDRPENLEVHTKAAHAAIHHLHGNFNVEYTSEVTIRSIVDAGKRHTYDVRMGGPDANFSTSSGFIIHNCGKSQIVRQASDEVYGHEADYEFKDFRAVLFDPVDLRGLPWIDTGNFSTKWLPPGCLPQQGKCGVMFLDELPQGTPAIQSGFLQLTLDGRIGEYELPERYAVVAAGNRPKDRSGASRLITALADRFVKFELEPSREDWVAWAMANNVHPHIVGFIQYRAECFAPEPDLDQLANPNPRNWVKVARLYPLVQPQHRLAVFSGIVGHAAVELIGYVDAIASLPPIRELIRTAGTFTLPTKPSHISAICAGFVAEIKETQSASDVDAAYLLGERLHDANQQEFGATLFNGAMGVARSVTLDRLEAAPGRSWRRKYKHLLGALQS